MYSCPLPVAALENSTLLARKKVLQRRNALDTLKPETSKIAIAHAHFSAQIHQELEAPKMALLKKQIETPLEKKCKTTSPKRGINTLEIAFASHPTPDKSK